MATVTSALSTFLWFKQLYLTQVYSMRQNHSKTPVLVEAFYVKEAALNRFVSYVQVCQCPYTKMGYISRIAQKSS